MEENKNSDNNLVVNNNVEQVNDVNNVTNDNLINNVEIDSNALSNNEISITQNSNVTSNDNQVVAEFSNANNEKGSTNSVSQPEIVSATQSENNANNTELIKPKKKVNKTLIVVLVFVGIFGSVMLFMTIGSRTNNTDTGNDEGQKESEIKVNVGTEWGNKYLTYMLKYKSELTTYEISFVDVNKDDVPEMFLKYIDNSDKETLKILYIAEDGYVYETKYYHDYRLRLIYSLKDKTTNWYLYLTTTKNYGSYTMISKIINEMAFDADIKATNDSLLIEYGKKYYDTDYQPVFYTIKPDSNEEDYKNFILKYEGYNKKVKDTISEVEDKYKDYQYTEEDKEKVNAVSLAGRSFKYGVYYAKREANVETNTEEETLVLLLNDDGTISVDGILYTYTINYEKSLLNIGDNKTIDLLNGEFMYNGLAYKYVGK